MKTFQQRAFDEFSTRVIEISKREKKKKRERERKSKQGRLNPSMEIECKLIYRLFDNDHSLVPAISSLDEVKGGEGGGGKGVGPGC